MSIIYYPRIQLKKGREKSVQNRHPWIFSGAIEVEPEVADGEIAGVSGSDGTLIGFGFYDKTSQIRVRLFEFDDLRSDFNQPEYWYSKLAVAYELRKHLMAESDTNAYRLLHAEGDHFPGLIIDIYGEVAVCQFLMEASFRRRTLITEGLARLSFNSVYFTYRNKSGWLTTPSESVIQVKENGLKFKVDFAEGQKTGFFLDQRDSRKLLSEFSRGKTVLNAFSYTGGFSVYAFQGGALAVDSVDISQSACKLAKENIELNYPGSGSRIIPADCFQFLREAEANYYDLIVLDPPAFAKSSQAVIKASRGYKDINMQAIRKIRKGGFIFTFSCSQHISRDLFQKIIFGAAADAGRKVRILYHLRQPPDHPVDIYHPEGDYLKGLMIQVL